MFLYSLVIVIQIVVSIGLVLFILMQSSKGGGLSGTFGGSQIGMTFGVRRASDFLSKTTVYLATIFMVLSLIVNLWMLPTSGERESVIQSNPVQMGTLPPPAPPTQ